MILVLWNILISVAIYSREEGKEGEGWTEVGKQSGIESMGYETFTILI